MTLEVRDVRLPTHADLEHIRYMVYVDIVAYTILTYDYAITFAREKALIWPMSFKSPFKALFFLTRYVSFVDLGINMWHNFTIMSVEDCKTAYKGMGFSIVIGFIIAEATLSVRTWAVWSRSRAIAISLAILFTIVSVTSLVVFAIFVDSVEFSPLPDHLPGCFVTGGSPIIAVDWMLVMLYEIVVLILMLIKAYQSYRLHGHSHVYKTVYRDGSLFYVYLTVLSTINIIIIVTLPPDLATILSNFQRAIHSVLTGRIILSLRELGNQTWDEESRIPSLPTIEFANDKKMDTHTSTDTDVI